MSSFMSKVETPATMGCESVRTPTLDRLARGGVVFEQAITQAPNTWVSHAGIFTLETSKEKLTRRFMSIIGRINGHRMNQGRLQANEWVQFVKLREQVEGMPIWIDDTPSLNIAEIRARARRQHKAGALHFLVVDYLQLAKPLKRGRSREEEVAELSRGLKSLAKELNIPVIALSQLSRAPEQRTGDHRPQLSDLRESGSIEQDADVVAFIFREEFYKKDDDDKKGIAEIIIAKQRNGPIGSVELAFIREYTRFENLSRERD